MLLTAGERISMALLSMAINDLGHDAVSFTGSQAGIVTDTSHGKARIVELRAQRVHEALDEGRIAIVAGFQGVSTTSDVTTLGRGGSDTTAVALAAGLGAEACEIYTDVEGVYTADPRIVPTARKLAAVSYEEMLELAASGAKVLALALGRVRSKPRRDDPRPLVVQRGGGHLGREGGGHARAGDHLGHRERHRRGEGDDPRRPRPAGDRRPRRSARSPTRGSTST